MYEAAVSKTETEMSAASPAFSGQVSIINFLIKKQRGFRSVRFLKSSSSAETGRSAEERKRIFVLPIEGIISMAVISFPA